MERGDLTMCACLGSIEIDRGEEEIKPIGIDEGRGVI